MSTPSREERAELARVRGFLRDLPLGWSVMYKDAFLDAATGRYTQMVNGFGLRVVISSPEPDVFEARVVRGDGGAVNQMDLTKVREDVIPRAIEVDSLPDAITLRQVLLPEP